MELRFFQMAGVRITTVVKKNENPDCPPLSLSSTSIVIDFLTKASLEADIFSAYPDIDLYADFFMTTTDAQFRGQGLASEMYKRAIKFLQKKKFPLCKSVLTSPFTQKACKNLQFTEHAKLFLKDYKDSEGNPYFPNANPDQFITVVAKRI